MKRIFKIIVAPVFFAASLFMSLPAQATSPLVITSTGLPQGVVGQSYSATMQAVGGAFPYVWSVSSGILPAGLSISTSGIISGTPIVVATSSFTVTVQDMVGASNSTSLFITVTSTNPIVISTQALPELFRFAGYYTILTATGGQAPYQWSLLSGNLPDGISISTSGIISGVPGGVPTSSDGLYYFTVQVLDSGGHQTQSTMTMGPWQNAPYDPLSFQWSGIHDGSILNFADYNNFVMLGCSSFIATSCALYSDTGFEENGQDVTSDQGPMYQYPWSPPRMGPVTLWVVMALNNGVIEVTRPVYVTVQLETPSLMPPVAGNQQVALSWNAVPGADSYQIYASTSPNLTPANATLTQSTTASSATVQGLTNGVTYYFLATASAGSLMSRPSPMVSAMPGASPANVQVLIFDSQVFLSWNDFSSATSYKIYESTTPGVSPLNATQVTQTPVSSTTISGLTNGVTYYFVVTALTQVGESAPSLQVSATPIAPSLTVISPANNTTVSGMVTFNGTAFDSQGLAEITVDYDGTPMFGIATGTSSWSFSFDAGFLSTGTHVVSVASWRQAIYPNSPSNESASTVVTLNVVNPYQASYDSTLMAPACHTVAPLCDSGGLVLGRGAMGDFYYPPRHQEPHQPNTIYDSCRDGTAGNFHLDQSNDRLRVYTLDGSPLAVGKIVTVEATVWSVGPAFDSLDLYYTSNINSPPTWTYLTTIIPPGLHTQILSSTFTLQAGALQVVRANFREFGSPSPCSSGVFDDADDLVFAVAASSGQPLVILSTALPQGTIGQSYSAMLQASGGTLPYSWSISSGTLPEGLSISTSGMISGIPSAVGLSTFTIEVYDNLGAAATQSFGLTIVPFGLSVVAPAGGEFYTAGQWVDVQWTMNGVTIPSPVPTTIKLLQGSSSGSPVLLLSDSAQSINGINHFHWQVPPGLNNANYYLEVAFNVNVYPNLQGVSAGAFSIQDSSVSAMAVVYPNGGVSLNGGGFGGTYPAASHVNLQWTVSQGAFTGSALTTLSIVHSNGVEAVRIASGTPPNGSHTGINNFLWVPPAGLHGTDLRLRVVINLPTGGTLEDDSDGDNTVTDVSQSPLLEVITPGEPGSWEEIYKTGQLVDFEWGIGGVTMTTPTATSIDLIGYTNSINLHITDAATSVSGINHFQWQVPPGLYDEGLFYIKVTVNNSGLLQGMTGNPFGTDDIGTPPVATVVYPNSGETLAGGSTVNLEWTLSSSVPCVPAPTTLSLVHSRNGAQAVLISSNVASTCEINSYSWTMPPQLSGTDLRFHVVVNTSGNGTLVADSVGDNTILPAQSTLVITSTSVPNAVAGEVYSDPLQAAGGVPPYTWSIYSGSLPPSLTLSTAGVISGVVDPQGPPNSFFPFTVNLKDSAGGSLNAAYGITVQTPIPPPLSLQIAPSSVTLTAGQSQKFVGNLLGALEIFTLTPAIGTITPLGLYTAPDVITSTQTVTIAVTDVFIGGINGPFPGPTLSSSGTITLVPSGISLTLPTPDLSSIPAQLPVNAKLAVAYPSGFATQFQWSLQPQGASTSQAVATPLPILDLSTLPLEPGVYTLSLQASAGSVVSALASTTVTLVLPAPTLNLPSILPINADINLNLPSGINFGSFHWVFTPTTSGSLAAPAPAFHILTPPGSQSFSSQVPKFNAQGAGLVPGEYSITVTAYDSAGNASLPAQAAVTFAAVDLEGVRVHPSPWRSDLHAGHGITFDNLPAGSTVKIFTIAGRWVKTLSNASGQTIWDLKNDDNTSVASGVYVYLVTDNQGNKAHGKFAVIR